MMSIKSGLVYPKSKLKMIERISPHSSNVKNKMNRRQRESLEEQNTLRLRDYTVNDNISENYKNIHLNSENTSIFFNTPNESRASANEEMNLNLRNPNHVDRHNQKSGENYIDNVSNETVKIENVGQYINNDDESENEINPLNIDVQPSNLYDNNKDKNYDTVYVKLEITPYIDESDECNVFHRDPSGISGHSVDSQNVIDSVSSIEAAIDDIKHGTLDENVYFECPHCHQFFNQPKRFLIHVKWHSFGIIVKNDVKTDLSLIGRAPRKNRDRKYIKQRRRKHICATCNEVCLTKEGLRLHRRLTHPMGPRECKVCGITLLSFMALRSHMSTHTSDIGYQCEHCPKWFKHWHSLAKHRGVHMEKTHGCSECPKKFGSQQLLRVHMRTHERAQHQPKFVCAICNKGFFASYNLKVHERSHRNEKPFDCHICHTSFSTKGKLQRHLKLSHSSTKPFECPTCHRSFISELMRDRHEMRVHGDPEVFKFQCTECPGRYLRMIDLKKHMYKLHPKRKRKVKSERE